MGQRMQKDPNCQPCAGRHLEGDGRSGTSISVGKVERLKSSELSFRLTLLGQGHRPIRRLAIAHDDKRAVARSQVPRIAFSVTPISAGCRDRGRPTVKSLGSCCEGIDSDAVAFGLRVPEHVSDLVKLI